MERERQIHRLRGRKHKTIKKKKIQIMILKAKKKKGLNRETKPNGFGIK
jgi:hypothetical protein